MSVWLYRIRSEVISVVLHRKGNYKGLFEQFFERMSDLTRNHVEAELCFDFVARTMTNIMQYFNKIR